MADIIYASFDRFPAPKGAAVHIGAFVRALGARYGNVALATVEPAPEDVPPGGAGTADLGPGVRHYPLPARGPHMIQRALHFRRHLEAFWKGRRPTVAHIRSIFEGRFLALNKSAHCEHLVYEVNGLPSIELKYHYPAVAEDRELMLKLTRQEDACLAAADRVLTVSQVSSRYLQSRGVPLELIRVIPNGVDLDVFPYQAPRSPLEGEVRLLYSGTMTSWQGVPVALEALALLRRDHPARLTLVGPVRPLQRKAIRERAHDLGIAEHVDLVPPVSQAELVRHLHGCDVFLAPLIPNDRNQVQGCCPLKVLEAMAAGTPVIASDLEVVRELARADVDALLVRPGSAKAIKDGVLRLLGEPDLGWRLSQSARRRVEQEFTWSRAQESLLEVYGEFPLVARCRNDAASVIAPA